MNNFNNFNPKQFVKKQEREQKLEDWQKFKLENEYKKELKPNKMTKKERKEKNTSSGLRKLKSILSGKAQNKQIFKGSKLAVVLPYRQGEKILGQRSKFFKDEYNKEALLAWD